MKVLHSKKYRQLPDLLNRADQHNSDIADYRTRWIARHCKVSIDTAATLATHAGLLNREES
jgi:hypothetical protein